MNVFAHPQDCDCEECSTLLSVKPVSQGADIDIEPDLPEPENADVYTETFQEHEPYSPPVKALANVTRSDTAHKVHAEAVERIFDLDRRMRSAFEEMEKAQALMKEIGIEIVVKFSRPMDSAWAAWKNERR